MAKPIIKTNLKGSDKIELKYNGREVDMTLSDFKLYLDEVLEPANAVLTVDQPLVYRGLLTQTGTSAPTVKVLENNLGGTLVWTYSGVGDYLVTLSGAFPDGDKVFARIGTSYGTEVGGQGAFYYNNANSLGLASQKNGSLSGAENGCFTDAPVEILIYS